MVKYQFPHKVIINLYRSAVSIRNINILKSLLIFLNISLQLVGD